MAKKIISRRAEVRKPGQVVKPLGLKEFYEQRRKLLIIRASSGIGDILMHRMMFEDIKLMAPDLDIHFACATKYHSIMRDHPYLDALVDCQTVDKTKYMMYYNTSTACLRYETKIAPLSGPHRSDIWANYCGYTLTNHDMHFRLTPQEIESGKAILESHRDRPGPIVVVSPVGVSSTEVKSLRPHQQEALIDGLLERGCCVMGLHPQPLPVFTEKKVPTVFNLDLRKWLTVINAADYVVSVDTGTFHCAGGLKKPLLGIYTFADGIVYGKYFDFVLVQKHRAFDPEWTCGPCYNWPVCPKTQATLKPCLTEITPQMILSGVDRMFEKWPINTIVSEVSDGSKN